MRRVSLLVCFVMILSLCAGAGVRAGELYLEPEMVSVIVSPEDGRDVRVLVYFELPAVLAGSDVTIDFAKVVFEAAVSDAYMGRIEIYPVTTSWKDAGEISWEGPWERDGGDYAAEHAGRSVTVKSGEGKHLLRSNSTYMVKAWLDGVMANNGLIVMASQDDLENSSVKYSIGRDGIKLKIHYSIDNDSIRQ